MTIRRWGAVLLVALIFAAVGGLFAISAWTLVELDGKWGLALIVAIMGLGFGGYVGYREVNQ